MGSFGCVCCEKFRCDFMAQTCALIAPVQPVLHRVSCTNKTLTNPTKHYETHQYMTLGSNGVDRVCSLPKITMRVHGTNFELIAPVQSILHRVSCSYKILPNTPKHYEMHTNLSLGSYVVDWVCSLQKILMRLHGTNFCINCTSSTRFAPNFV